MTANKLNRELYDLCFIAFKREDEQSWSNIRQWLETNAANHKRLKMAENYQSDYHTTPLHRILGSRTPLDIVEALIKHAPETVRNVDDGGRLPLHIACYRGASLEVLDALVRAYPKSYDVLSILDKKPSDFLKEWAQNTRGNEPMMLLQKAIVSGFHVNLVKLLLQAFPKSAMIKDSNDMIPLHHAHIHGFPPAVISRLIEAYPEGVYVKDNQGNLPSNYGHPGSETAEEVDEVLPPEPEEEISMEEEEEPQSVWDDVEKTTDEAKWTPQMSKELNTDIIQIKGDTTEMKASMNEQTLCVTRIKSEMAQLISNFSEMKCELAVLKSEMIEVKSFLADIQAMLRGRL